MSGIDRAVATPARVTIVNLATGEEQEVMFNPETLPDELQVNYERLGIPGLSHQPLQYAGTGNNSFSLELFVIANTAEEADRADEFRLFVDSLCYPRAGATDVLGGGPPDVLLVWPNLLSIRCRVTARKHDHRRFAQDGSSTHYTTTLTVEETRDARLTSEDVRRVGSRRSSRTGDGTS